ncbi:4-hydroxy-tetrahydrodipicolinate synthase [Candidatus Micrarchaeota archaeon]|nr:4-hydroxy-tetrahydrodipicolinate synthase [Candidatus Micrarchaeota archaeon]
MAARLQTRPEFKGIFLPIISPFRDGKIDFKAIDRMVDYYLAHKISGFVTCGSTGEAFSLSARENGAILRRVLMRVHGRVPVIAGCGEKNLERAIHLAKQSQRIGAVGALSIVPPTLNPTIPGTVAFFKALAHAVPNFPFILYNNPPRTGVNIGCDATIELSQVPNIVGIKESNDNIIQFIKIVQGAIQPFSVLGGNDNQFFSFMCAGAAGAIAAPAHVRPDLFLKVYQDVNAHNLEAARETFFHLVDLVAVLFSEPNPTAVKVATEILGLSTAEARIPIVPATSKCRGRVEEQLIRLQSVPIYQEPLKEGLA